MLASNQARLLSVTPEVAPAARLSDYIAIARPDHWIKHVLIVPGAVFAAIMSPAGSLDYASLGSRLIVCLIVAMALSSANYTINEWLDAPFDAMHPTKRARKSVAVTVRTFGLPIIELNGRIAR